jgi:hypothetical protein
MEFIVNYANWVSDNFNKMIDTPKIHHGPKGGIDILWEKENYQMLIYIDKDGKNGFFHANDFKGQISDGQFDPQNINFNLLPLTIIP